MSAAQGNACIFCHSSTEDCNLGQLLRAGNTFAHYFCTLLSHRINQSGADHEGIYGFLEDDIKAESLRGKNHKCYICNGKGATLQCARRKCKRSFHLPCALERNCSINFLNYQTLCSVHSNQRYISIRKALKDKEAEKCPICMDDVADYKKLLKIPCCDKILHKSCLQHYTLNSGYFTKCPTCNATDIFIKYLAENGIFVPCCDASWEQDENAYQELLFTYKQCDAETCLCPYGRTHFSKRWALHRCKYCGSSAMHKKCGKIHLIYICAKCKS